MERAGTPQAGEGPLAGLRVIDCSTVLAGPLAAQLLGDFGAEVIKVEHPVHGDPLRHHGAEKDGVALWWKTISRNKRSVGLYLGDPQAAELVARLVDDADVLIESFRPGTMERYGLGPDRLCARNPRLVYLRVTGYGQDGPYAQQPAFGTLMEAMSGFAHVTGQPDEPPTLPPFGLADSIAGLSGAMAVSMALHHRASTSGRGQVIDQSILEPIVTALGPQPITYDQTGIVQQRSGNRSANNAPRNTYATRDGRWVGVSTSTTSVAARVMRLVGHPEVVDEPWFSSGRGRAAHADLLDRYVADWVRQRPRDEVLRAFADAEAAAAPVYDIAELMGDPQARARQMFTTVEDPELGPVRMQNVLARFEVTPGAIRHTGPALGADTAAVLVDELGVDPAELARLRQRGVCR